MASQVVKIEKSISVLGHSLLKSESRQVADPQKETGQSEGRVIEPPYDPEKIAELVQLSSILPQCISAMVIGCERKYMLEQREDGVKTSDEEWSKVDTFFSKRCASSITRRCRSPFAVLISFSIWRYSFT